MSDSDKATRISEFLEKLVDFQISPLSHLNMDWCEHTIDARAICSDVDFQYLNGLVKDALRAKHAFERSMTALSEILDQWEDETYEHHKNQDILPVS